MTAEADAPFPQQIIPLGPTLGGRAMEVTNLGHGPSGSPIDPVQAMAAVQRKSDTREPKQQAAYVGSPPKEINLILCVLMTHISNIKLIRTDTTLDLSQKAEKGMLRYFFAFIFYNQAVSRCYF
ncbi:vacuolar ATP synthase catalytic subunit-related / V-ATPase-related / vacuolar proton pump-like protein [Perilla frutescens var. hirtella]|nr:vacuolar ATP synthase catalytic subunit-related / V-ATPase-related / vacuolar proton pump-like protein [Perilla frutescens var. hirtella]